jgi:hypothetical protein
MKGHNLATLSRRVVERQEDLVHFLSRGEPTLSDQNKLHKASPETDAFWQFVLHLPPASSTPK